jgi:XTP/dITP diphosphohydrolase
MDLLLATHNAHKTQEFRAILGNDFELNGLSIYPEIAVAPETGATFEANAIAKAVSVSQDRQLRDRPASARLRRGRHLLVIADDSGLEVDALDGAPGIYSARYAGENATDRQNIDKLVSELRRTGSTPGEWRARFRCVIALARDGKLIGTFEGVVEGTVVAPARGSHGFGYDPVFVPAGFEKTLGELPADVKNKISHRARAIHALRARLMAIERGG